MTPNARKKRISGLWDVARKQVYKKQIFIGRARNVVSSKVQADIAGTDVNNANFHGEKQKSDLPWYLFDPNGAYLPWWQFFMDLVTIYFIFITPIFIVFE